MKRLMMPTMLLMTALTAEGGDLGGGAGPAKPTGAAALPQPTSVRIWEYDIPINGEQFTMGEMALAFEAAQNKRSMQDIGFIMEFLAEAITNRCDLAVPVTAYDLRKKWINPTELMDVFSTLYAPFMAKVNESKAEGKPAAP